MKVKLGKILKPSSVNIVLCSSAMRTTLNSLLPFESDFVNTSSGATTSLVRTPSKITIPIVWQSRIYNFIHITPFLSII